MSVLTTYAFATTLLAVLVFALTRSVLVSFALRISVIGWWGWLLWVLGVASTVDPVVAVALSLAMPLFGLMTAT
ncbi:MAG: hypothetical protein QW432_00555 [Desulfurococcaceae archaeon]